MSGAHDDRDVPDQWLLYQFQAINTRLDAGFARLERKMEDHAKEDAAVERRVSKVEIDFDDRRKGRQRRDKVLVTLVSAPWLIEIVHLVAQHWGMVK